MKNRLLRLGVFLILLSALMSALYVPKTEMQKYSDSFFGTFDTVVTVIGYAESEDEFSRNTQTVKEILEYWHRLTDIYHAYDGITNLYTVNRDAGKRPVKVNDDLMRFLRYAVNCENFCGTREVNIAMGTVLSLWHDARTGARTAAALPDAEALQTAAAHMDIDKLILNETAGTVFFADAEMKLDVGCLAKGYAVERAAEYLESSNMKRFVISAGGNVRTGEAPMDGRPAWKVGIQSPDDPNTLAQTVQATHLSVVTSGDYERYFIVDGQRFHHIVSPVTLYPSGDFRSVTVATKDSGWADFLSTRLFLMRLEDGLSFVQSLKTSDMWQDAEVLWILKDGTVRMTDGMRDLLGA